MRRRQIKSLKRRVAKRGYRRRRQVQYKRVLTRSTSLAGADRKSQKLLNKYHEYCKFPGFSNEFSSLSAGHQGSAVRSGSQEDKGVINDILGGHSMRFMDKNKIRRIQESVEGIRIKKVQNRSKMEKILSKLQKAIFRNEMKIKWQEQKASVATSGYQAKRSEKTQVQSNMHDVIESKSASEQDDEVVFGGEQELDQNQYCSITSGQRLREDRSDASEKRLRRIAKERASKFR